MGEMPDRMRASLPSLGLGFLLVLSRRLLSSRDQPFFSYIVSAAPQLISALCQTEALDRIKQRFATVRCGRTRDGTRESELRCAIKAARSGRWLRRGLCSAGVRCSRGDRCGIDTCDGGPSRLQGLSCQLHLLRSPPRTSLKLRAVGRHSVNLRRMTNARQVFFSSPHTRCFFLYPRGSPNRALSTLRSSEPSPNISLHLFVFASSKAVCPQKRKTGRAVLLRLFSLCCLELSFQRPVSRCDEKISSAALKAGCSEFSCSPTLSTL